MAISFYPSRPERSKGPRHCGNCKFGVAHPESDTGFVCTVGKYRTCYVDTKKAYHWQPKENEP